MKRLNSKELQSFAESLNTISEKTKPEDININMLDMLGPLMKSGFSGGTAGLRDALRKRMIEKGGDPAEVDAYIKKMQQNKTAPEASSDAETKTEPETKTKPDPYQSRPSSTKSDFEDRQAQVIRAQQRDTSATQRQVDKDNQRYGNTVPAGSFNISPKGSDRRNEVEAQIKRDNAARTDDQRVLPKLTDQQKVRAEYDRLRYSKDPKERAQAVTYGRQMAAAGAAKKNFSGYKSAADAKKNLPAPAQRTSIADRLKAIRDMRASSQSRITAQGGKPATPAVQPKTQPAGNIVKSGSGATLSNAPKNDLAKGSTPIVVNRGTTEKTSYAYNKPVMGSMAQRLQAIRARQNRPQTPPAVQPKVQPAVQPKVQPDAQTNPAVTPNQKSSIQRKVDNVRKPVQTGDKPVVKVNPNTSEMELKQKRSKDATDKIKSSLDMS